MSTPKPGQVWRDREGRQFRLVKRYDARGSLYPPGWVVEHFATGVTTSIREDRLLDPNQYVRINQEEDQ